MPKYQRKPLVFDALQFKGGTANARTIVESAATLAPNFIVRYQTATSEWGMANGAITEFKIPERLRIESMLDQTVTYAPVGSWVMVSKEGLVDVLTDAEFTNLYQSA